MNDTTNNLERVFSRYLDGECTPAERDQLESLLSQDAEVRELFEDYRDLDQQVGEALRAALGRAPRRPPARLYWVRLGKGLAVAAAASLAAITWLHSTQSTTRTPGPGSRTAQAASWFAPLTPATDVVQPVPSAYTRPELRVRGTQRDWIVIPGDRPGEYLVIEVDRVRTHVIGVHQDF